MRRDTGHPGEVVIGRRVLWAVFGAILLAGCGEPGPRQQEISHQPPSPSSIGEGALDDIKGQLTSLICRIYEDWPEVSAAEALAGSVQQSLGSLTSQQRQELEGELLGQLAARMCPQAIDPLSVPASGRLPVPLGMLANVPGLFDAGSGRGGREDLARYEWTATGLGCMGLSQGGADRDMREKEAQFLASMGYSLEHYIEVSLSIDDPDMSDRIFRRILMCARRADAEILEK